VPDVDYYALTKHADIVEVSRRPMDFSSEGATSIVDLPAVFNEFYGSMISAVASRADRTADPTGDVITKLVRVQVDGEPPQFGDDRGVALPVDDLRPVPRRPETYSRVSGGAPSCSSRRATSYARRAPMLCPKKASGRSAGGRTAGKIASARAGRRSMLGSVRRSWRPGYCTAETPTAGDSAEETFRDAGPRSAARSALGRRRAAGEGPLGARRGWRE
jgi:hypothetical protein